MPVHGQSLTRVVIAGGGTAGWTAAAALAQQLGPLLDITLVESEEIGTVGVGEATIPTIRTFHTLLGLDEREFMRATQASFKLGIAFENWARAGDRYIHAFGDIGKTTWMGGFHNMWLMAKAAGFGGELGEYCVEYQAAEAGKFAISEIVADQLRVPPGCRPLRPVSAREIRAQGRPAHRRQDRPRGAGRRKRARDCARHAERHARGGRPVHRLHRISRPADRADAQGRVRGLASLAANRQRSRSTDTVDRPHPAVHTRDRAQRRMAMAHTVAEPGR